MSDQNRILIRNAREQDIPAVVEITAESSSPSGPAKTAETFQRHLTTFPNGFIILVAENEIAAYGYSEKWLSEREPGSGANPATTHQPDGRVFYIAGMAVKTKSRGRGYRLMVLDKLMEIAHNEGCRKIILETTDGQDVYLQRGFQPVQGQTEGGIPTNVMALDIESYGSKA